MNLRYLSFEIWPRHFRWRPHLRWVRSDGASILVFRWLWFDATANLVPRPAADEVQTHVG